jgi:hypothetical protein
MELINMAYAKKEKREKEKVRNKESYYSFSIDIRCVYYVSSLTVYHVSLYINDAPTFVCSA